MQKDEIVSGFILELRRGTVILCVLAKLNKPTYGYNLITELSETGIAVEANTLYPMLRRLESQGLLESQWDTSETRPRKYYSLSERGHSLYIRLRDEWRQMSDDMEKLLNGEYRNE